MVLENKLGITESGELARKEERISKKKALELFENGILDSLEAGKFESLSKIHKYIFQDIYTFAGEIRNVNIAKGNFRFAPVMYLEHSLAYIDKMPQSMYFDRTIAKWRLKCEIWYRTFEILVGNFPEKVGNKILYNSRLLLIQN